MATVYSNEIAIDSSSSVRAAISYTETTSGGSITYSDIRIRIQYKGSLKDSSSSDPLKAKSNFLLRVGKVSSSVPSSVSSYSYKMYEYKSNATTTVSTQFTNFILFAQIAPKRDISSSSWAYEPASYTSSASYDQTAVPSLTISLGDALYFAIDYGDVLSAMGWMTAVSSTAMSATMQGAAGHQLITAHSPVTYTVSYNANGGTGTTSSQTKTYGQNLTLRSNGFTRTNYAFKCWNTDTSDPAASRYAESATYTGNAALALYAIWNPIISFNANGGSGAPANQTKTFNSQFSLASLAVPTRTGYTFANWNTAANGSGTSYASNGTIEASDNTAKTLYAQWTANVYEISFNANGGTNAPSSISKTYGQSVTLPTAKPTRVGHTFLGWSDSSSATSAQWLAGANFSEAITSDTTLYAVWRDDYESPSITTLRAYRCGFELTQDTAIDPDKTYYERSGSGTSEDPYVYTEVDEPDVSEISTYYELVDDDEAGYARVEATWSIDTTVDEGVTNTATMTGTITPEGQQAQSITFQSGYQGTSGNAVALIDGLDVDTQYTVTVTVTDIKGASAATSRTVLLLRAFYIFDFGSQGNAVGIGRAAPQSGMEVGYRATFDDEVNLYDELQFNGEQAFPTFKRSSWTPASDETTLPVLPCEVVDEGTSEAFWCDSDGVHRINHAGMTWGQLASRYTWGELAPEGSTPGGAHTYLPVVEVATTAEAEAISDIERPFLAYVTGNGGLYRVS